MTSLSVFWAVNALLIDCIYVFNWLNLGYDFMMYKYQLGDLFNLLP